MSPKQTKPAAPPHDSPLWVSSPLLMVRGLIHGFTTRQGGVSSGSFSSLNFGEKGGDRPENVQRNLALLAKKLGFDGRRFYRGTQVHGREVAVVTGEDPPQMVAQQPSDALVSNQAGVTLGVKTADCVPVLFYDPEKQVIGAAHAGWRGIVAGILQNTLAAMEKRFSCSASQIRVAIGPCIGPCCYEVGMEVAEQFSSLEGVLHKQEGKAPHLDLVTSVHQLLIRAGIDPTNISRAGQCTSCDRALFFSYRRDGASTGHHLSVIGLLPK